MARPPGKATRDSSTDSSALSNIQVAAGVEEDSASDQLPTSTPPTSLGESSSAGSAKAVGLGAAAMPIVEEGARRSSRRARQSVNYNLKTLSDAQMEETLAEARSRNASGISGQTLVDALDVELEPEPKMAGTPFEEKVEKAMNMEWEIPDELPPRPESSRPTSKREAVSAGVKKTQKAVEKVGSVLGKRSREVWESAKDKVEDSRRKLEGMKEGKEKDKLLRELDTGKKGYLDELDLDAADPPAPVARPTKKPKREAKAPVREPGPLVAAATASGVATGRKGKKWQKEGLYVGQSTYHAATHPRNKLQKKRPGSSASSASQGSGNMGSTERKQPLVPLPMFNHLSEDKQRDFIIPFDVFAPTSRKGDEKPKDWHQLNKNRLIGEAKTLWEKEERLARSLCTCKTPAYGEQGCGDHCLNRAMHYECNNNNCILSAGECSNRPFADLAARMKKAGPYDIGVEVVKTPNRGFGVRSCRTFAPNSIIMEYTGEIISEDECQRRMAEKYLNKPNYYLMEFDKGLIIDGTRGSMARFVNHSCAPNCEVRMLTVNGTPRMGVFAGDGGVMTGEELTYDYNFDNFGSTRQVCYCGAPTCRGFLSKRLNATEQKLRDKKEAENQRRAAEEAERNAEVLEKAKKTKSDRGSGWRGWVTVADVKEDLKREKAEREEAEKNSSRAQRLAKRKSEIGATAPAEIPVSEPEKPAKRRKSTTKIVATEPLPAPTQKSTIRRVSSESAPAMAEEGRASVTVERKVSTSSRKTSAASTARPGHKRTHSALSGAGSKFTEEVSPKLERPSTGTSSRKVTRTKSAVFRSGSVAEDGVALPGNLDGAVNEEVERPSKRARLGDMVKNFMRGGKKSSASAPSMASGNSGKLKQSTLSFAKKA